MTRASQKDHAPQKPENGREGALIRFGLGPCQLE